MTLLSLWTVAFSCLLAAAFSGCRSITPPVTFYTLRSISGEMADVSAVGNVAVTIGIRPVVFPGYLNRTQMVKRTSSHQLEISSLHRWVDFPDRLVQQVLVENLQVLMPDARVFHSPWPVGLNPDLSITFQFLELIGTTDKTMLLSAVWTISGNDQPSVVQSHRTTYSAPISGSGYEDLAAAHSRALKDLCLAVARTLTVFLQTGTP